MPLKNENKSNAVYNDFKVVWNAPSQKAKQSTTKESKPLLDGRNEISSDEKAGFNILNSRILICKPDGRTMVLQNFTPPGFRTTSATSLKTYFP